MTLSRRDFTLRLSAALGGLALPHHLLADHAGRQASTLFQWTPVSDRVRVATGGGGNAILVLGGRGGLVSDGKNFGLGRTLRREAESWGVRVTRFVNTHHHGDHSGGNSAFLDAWKVAHAHAAPRIRATAQARLEGARESLGELADRMEAEAAPSAAVADILATRDAVAALTADDFVPDQTFDTRIVVEMEDQAVEVTWVSPGHTDGDAFVYVPGDNVLHCGDLFFNGRHPYVDDSAGATPAGWIRCVDAMLGVCDERTVVVPGHGEITDRAGLEGQKRYFQRLQAMVETAVAEGRTRDEVTALAPEDLAAMVGAERHLPRNLGIVYDEVTA